jgi:YD repeat-containing protein
VTTYGSDDTTGELLSVSYNDSTPAVTYVYDRLGRQQTITDGTGSRTFSYDPNTLDLTTETLTGLTPAVITHKHSTTGLLGRPTGLKLGTTYDVTYDYDQHGRFQTLSWTIDGTQDSATYTRVDDSDLLAGYTTASGMSVGYGYEPGRDLKTQVANRWNGSVVSQYDYRYDAIGRRTSVETSGSAFGPSKFTSWGYDARNQLTASNRYTGSFTESPNLANEVAAERRGFDYDPIGNRESALDQDGATSITYAANELNQYESVGSEEPTYDEDGNLLDDGTKVLAYNAENQLVRVEVPGVSVSTYDYDYLGRRTRKSVDL